MSNIRPASGLISFLMRVMGFDGWASLWNVVYIQPWALHDQGLLRRGSKQLEQMQRDGKLTYTAKYLWWCGTRGYWNNPYEIEARQAQFEWSGP